MKYLVVIITLVFLDQATKALVTTISLNTGISFGMFSGEVTVLVIAISTFFFLLSFFFRSYWLDHPLIYTLLFSGVTANLLDRIRFGGVRDWLVIPFSGLSNNFADYYIFLAILLTTWQMFKELSR